MAKIYLKRIVGEGEVCSLLVEKRGIVKVAGGEKLSGIYKNVIATNVNENQLQFADKLSNLHYQHMPSPLPSVMSLAELAQKVAPGANVDLVTIAQALHWFDLPTFYQQVKWVLKKPHRVIVAWCYNWPQINDAVNSVSDPFYASNLMPSWDPTSRLVKNDFRGIDFPFKPVDGVDHTRSFEFVIEKVMDLNDFFNYLRSECTYQTTEEKGTELLSDDVVEKFKQAWNEDGYCSQRVAKFPVYFKIGRVGNA